MKTNRGHRQIEHTADLALEIWASAEEELYEEAAVALIEILTENAKILSKEEKRLNLEALDAEDRLVRWLNQVLLLALLDGFLLGSARISLQGETGLEAVLEGEPDAADKVLTELKSVTYHDLSLEVEQGVWRARVVIDV